MAGKSLPLLAMAAGAALLLTSKKKGQSKKSSPTIDGQDPNIVLSGTKAGWKWRVRQAPSQPGFADQYFGEIQSPASSTTWITAHEKGRPNPVEAKLLAWERIAQELAANGQTAFVWEPARTNYEAQLREQYPEASLSLLDSGSITKNGVQCHWAIMSVLPPIAPGAYAGFLICPSTNEQDSAFSNSIEAIKKDLGIGL